MEAHIEDMKTLTQGVSEVIGDYWRTLETASPACHKEQGFLLKRVPMEAPENPERWADIMADVREHIFSGVSKVEHF